MLLSTRKKTKGDVRARHSAVGDWGRPLCMYTLLGRPFASRSRTWLFRACLLRRYVCSSSVFACRRPLQFREESLMHKNVSLWQLDDGC